jgi:hypothetical protein
MFRSISMMLAFLVLVLARPALADECTSPVFDSTGKVNASEVEPLLKKIQGDGADPALVRVLTTAQMNQHGNLDKYAGDMLSRCPSWQSAGGRLKANIFLLILEPNGKVAVQFAKKGPFQSILHDRIVDISQEMGGLIGKGDLTGAAKAGLIRAHALLSAPKPAAPIVANGPVTIVNHNEKPTDLSGGFSFLKWLLAIGVAGGLIWLLFFMRAKKEKTLAAQQTAQGKLASCNNLIVDFDSRLSRVGSLLNSYKATIGASDFTSYQATLQELNDRLSSAKSRFTNSTTSSNDPASTGLSADQYDAMADVFDRHLTALNEFDSALTRFEGSVSGIGKLRDGAQPAIDSLTAEIESATSVVNAERALKTDGPRAILKDAINLLERATKELEAKSFKAVSDTCKEGVATAKRAAQQVRDLASRKQNIENSISQLDRLVMTEKLASIDALISDIRVTYGEGSEAPALEQRTLVIQKTQERQSAITMAKSGSITQNWDLAEQQIAIAKSAESAIDNAISTVQNLSRRLANARRPQSNSYRPSSGGSSRSSHVTNTTVVNNYGSRRYDDDGLGLGLGLGLALDNIETNAENRELRRELREERGGSWGGGGSSRSDDDDGDSGFGGGSVQTSSNEDDDSGFGGGSVDTSSSSDDSGFGGGGSDD